jgi:transposase
MLDESTRSAVLRLRSEGHGTRTIARALGISRGAVKEIVSEGKAQVPAMEREEKAEPYRERILALFASCKGNLVRVHEELAVEGAKLSYPALTSFCRRHGIGHEPELPSGRYEFEPGEEMQHDTSPHDVEIGGKKHRVQTASLVLCHSRMIFVQMYPRFTRFECKVFLTDAFCYFGGACAKCMIDNTHVIVLHGTGPDMVAVPEMVAFGERFETKFHAHRVGHANRSARVERPFDFIENNFLAGRKFSDWDDLNRRAIEWCERGNATHRRHLHASPRELFVAERARMKPLPVWVPEVYALHHRIVDTEGYVNVQRSRYSVPWQLLGRQLEVRETKDRIDVFDGPRLVASHKKLLDAQDTRVTNPEHRPPRSEGVFARRSVSAEEKRLSARMVEMAEYVALLKKRDRGTARELRWLVRMVEDYPEEALRGALVEATRYGMTDLERLDRMVLRRVEHDFFKSGHDAGGPAESAEKDKERP